LMASPVTAFVGGIYVVMAVLWTCFMRHRFAGPKVSRKLDGILRMTLNRFYSQEEEILAIVAKARDRSAIAFELDDVST
jgi:hypothetical protein